MTNPEQNDDSQLRNLPGVQSNRIIQPPFEMSGVPTLEIDALAIDLECLPPMQRNSLFEDSSDDSSNESDIQEDYKEVYEYADSD